MVYIVWYVISFNHILMIKKDIRYAHMICLIFSSHSIFAHILCLCYRHTIGKYNFFNHRFLCWLWRFSKRTRNRTQTRRRMWRFSLWKRWREWWIKQWRTWCSFTLFGWRGWYSLQSRKYNWSSEYWCHALVSLYFKRYIAPLIIVL